MDINMSFESIPLTAGLPSFSQAIKTEKFEEKLISSIISSLPDVSEIRQKKLPEATKERLILTPLEQMAKKAEEMFKALSSETLDSSQFLEFMTDGFLKIITSIVKEAESLPLDSIAECGVNEAAFSNALDQKPIVATDSLATCIGIAGYESESRSGFVIHISTEDNLEASKEMLIEKIMQLSMKYPIQLHLRGGIKGLSEPLMEAIERWIKSASEKGCQMVVVSKEVLTEGLLSSSGVPNTMSISLDTRNGAVSSYDCSINPYAKQKIQISNSKEVDDIFTQLIVKSALEKPEIKVVYFPSK